MDATFLQEQIDQIKAIITAYNATILALTIGQNSQYTLDTGQTRQTVTKLDLDKLREDRQSYMNELATLDARLNGSGSLTVTPAW